MPRQQLPDIDARLCTLCGDCVAVCPTDCLVVAQGLEIVLAPQRCINCGVCEAVCPVDAITMCIRDW
jgi:formate hydrogenlyase subunit 6/NADH:ubiquinone oxidoreductase subunit I